MTASSFDDLVSTCVTSGFKHRMLYVFVRIGTMDEETKIALLGPDASDEEAGYVQVLFDAHQPAAHGLTFDAVRDTANAHSTDWDMVVIGTVRNDDVSLPTDEQAHAALAMMRDQILAGDIADYVILAPSGKPIVIEADTPPVQ